MAIRHKVTKFSITCTHLVNDPLLESWIIVEDPVLVGNGCRCAKIRIGCCSEGTPKMVQTTDTQGNQIIQNIDKNTYL